MNTKPLSTNEEVARAFIAGERAHSAAARTANGRYFLRGKVIATIETKYTLTPDIVTVLWAENHSNQVAQHVRRIQRAAGYDKPEELVSHIQPGEYKDFQIVVDPEFWKED